jgi:cullin 1
MTHTPDEIKTWFDANRYITTYTAVYKYCVAPRVAVPGETPVYFHGEKVYRNLVLVLSDMFGKCGDDLLSIGDNGMEMVKKYNDLWEKMTVISRHIAAIFMYVERHWIERQLSSSNSNRSGGSSSSTPQVFRVKQLVYLTWRTGVIDKIVGSVKDKITSRLCQERTSHSLVFDEQLKLFILNVEHMSDDIALLTSSQTEKSQVFVYREVIEPVYLQCLKEQTEAINQPITSLDQLRSVWDEEQARARFYLPKCGLEKVNSVLKTVLFVPCIDMVTKEFNQALSEWDSEKCLEISRLMGCHPDLLVSLDAAFARFCTDNLARLPDSARPDQFVKSILSLHRQATDFIKNCLNNRPSILTAFDQAFRQYLRAHRGGRIHEYLAIYLDHAISDSSNGGGSGKETDGLAGFKATCSDILAVFKFLDDKDAFNTAFSKLTATRLLSHDGINYEREQFVINSLTYACGSGYTGQLQRMLSDCKSSQALSIQQGSGEFLVITSGSWPISETTAYTAFTWPDGIGEKINAFTLKYCTENPKKKLQWLPHLSRVEVDFKLGGTGTPQCTLVMTAVQSVIMSALVNDEGGANAFTTADVLARSTQLPVQVISKVLEQAGKIGFLTVKEGANGRLGYQLNSQFNPQTSPVYFDKSLDGADGDIVMADAVDDGLGTSVNQLKTEEECKVIVSAAIVKLAKKEKKIQLSELVSQVQDTIRPWIPLCPADLVMSTVEQCIEREFIERCAADIIQYLP